MFLQQKVRENPFVFRELLKKTTAVYVNHAVSYSERSSAQYCQFQNVREGCLHLHPTFRPSLSPVLLWELFQMPSSITQQASVQGSPQGTAQSVAGSLDFGDLQCPSQCYATLTEKAFLLDWSQFLLLQFVPSVCAPLQRALLHHSLAAAGTAPSPCSFHLVLCSLPPPALWVSSLLSGFSWYLGVQAAQCDKDGDAAIVPSAYSSLKLAKCLYFVLGKESGEPGRQFPITSPWQQAFQMHVGKQAEEAGSITVPVPVPQPSSGGAPCWACSMLGEHTPKLLQKQS